MTEKLINHNFTYTTNPLVCDKCGKHPSKHRLYPTAGICGTFIRTKNGLVSAKEEPYHPSFIEKILHFFGKHIWPSFWKKSFDDEGHSKYVFEYKNCLYPNCKVYKIK